MTFTKSGLQHEIERCLSRPADVTTLRRLAFRVPLRLEPYARKIDHFGPFHHIRFDIGAKFVGRIANGLGAIAQEALLQIGRAQRFPISLLSRVMISYGTPASASTPDSKAAMVRIKREALFPYHTGMADFI